MFPLKGANDVLGDAVGMGMKGLLHPHPQIILKWHYVRAVAFVHLDSKTWITASYPHHALRRHVSMSATMGWAEVEEPGLTFILTHEATFMDLRLLPISLTTKSAKNC